MSVEPLWRTDALTQAMRAERSGTLPAVIAIAASGR